MYYTNISGEKQSDYAGLEMYKNSGLQVFLKNQHLSP